MSIEIRDTAASRSDTVDRVDGILNADSLAKGFPFEVRDMAFEAWDEDTFLGGITARMTQGWAYVTLLAVSDAARGRGIGQDLLARVEAEVRAADGTGIWLDTYSFQAPCFYRKMGFEEFGSLDDTPDGQSRHFFRKRLT